VDGFFFSVVGKWSYLGLFGILLAAGLGVPLPEDIPLLASGWLVHHGQADLRLMMLTGLLGVMIGDTMIFTMGRRYGTRIIEHRWLRTIAKPWLLEKARQKYADHGAKILFAARFMPGLRSVLFLTAGVCKVPYWKFCLIDGIAALISVPAWVWIGFKFSARMEKIAGGTRVATYVIAALLVLALILWGFYEYYHSLRKKNRDVIAADEALANIVRSAPLVNPHARESPRRDTAKPDGLIERRTTTT